MTALHSTRLASALRLCLAILMVFLILGCSSETASETTGRPTSPNTPEAETEVQAKSQATAEAVTATTTSSGSSATSSSTPAPSATPLPPATPAPAVTSKPAPTLRDTPGTETPVHEATDEGMPPSHSTHARGSGSEASGEATAPVDGRADSFNPGPGAGDGDESQVRSIPDKGELKYPNLGSHLDGLVVSVEEGRATAEEAAAESPVYREGSIAVTIHLSGNVDSVVAFLKEKSGDPRNVGEDYIEAYVPVTALGLVSDQPGVLQVRAIIPPQADQIS